MIANWVIAVFAVWLLCTLVVNVISFFCKDFKTWLPFPKFHLFVYKTLLREYYPCSSEDELQVCVPFLEILQSGSCASSVLKNVWVGLAVNLNVEREKSSLYSEAEWAMMLAFLEIGQRTRSSEDFCIKQKPLGTNSSTLSPYYS